jgi:hypothetical protein
MNRLTVGRVGQVLILVLAATLLPAAPAFSQSAAFARTDYPFLGDQAAGDFNGDGRLDLAGLGVGSAVIMHSQ